MNRTTQYTIVTLGLLTSLIIALSVWLQNQPDDLWSRRWLLIIIPTISGIALLISWRHVWQDVALGNLHLLRLGVSRNLDDLHAIAQRRRNCVELVRGGNKEHLRKIELHLKVVVLEG